MSLAEKLHKPTVHERLTSLEKAREKHDAMAEQFAEIYEAWVTAKKLFGAVKWFRITIIGGFFGLLGAIAVILTIYEKVSALLSHH